MPSAKTKRRLRAEDAEAVGNALSGIVPVLPAADRPSVPTDPQIEPDEALFPGGGKADLAQLAGELRAELDELGRAALDDPASNPVMRLALTLTRRLQAGSLDYGVLERLVQHLAAEGFLYRAARLGRLLGETDPEANAERLRGLLRRLAGLEDDGAVSFEAFQQILGREVFGIVFTAHPTFNLSGELMEILATLATGRSGDGRPLTDGTRAELVAAMASRVHRPDSALTLDREHALSLVAIGHARAALRRVHEIALDVAAEAWPDRWTELVPRVMTVASWVGYDLDGRSDIRWTDTLHKRLLVQVAQLRHCREELRAARAEARWPETAGQALELLESRLALAVNEATDEADAFAMGPAGEDAPARIARISRRMHDGLALRMTDAAAAVELIDRAIRLTLAADEIAPEAVRRLCVLRADLAGHGLGLAHTHVRINATQLHNAIRKTVGMETAPDDPRFRQSYLNAVNELLDSVEPASVNFGSLLAERTSAKRLFMLIAQMLKYADAGTPVRFLIAECETAFTALTALYYARLFGVEDRVDISPLFETERALEVGSRVIEQLLENPHYRAYVRRRGRLCIQTGYSDAGRYLGQTPAAASIERLKMRIARLFPKHGLDGVELVIFDTHGESIGRGAHPAGFPDRLSYVSPPTFLAFLAENGIAYKQETSFQGGDGYLPFVTPAGAFAVVTRVIEYMFGQYGPARRPFEPDPFYEDPDYITEFFTTVKEFQVALMRDPNYALLLSTYGPGLLYPSGSRATKRQQEGGDGSETPSASQTRAIPHNAILMQLGLPANAISGVGEAIAKDPGRFRQLLLRSPRFRQLLGVVGYGLAISEPDALRAYVDTLDPATWLLRAGREGEAARAEELRTLAAFLEEGQLHARQVKILRKLLGDWWVLRDALGAQGGSAGSPGSGSVPGPGTEGSSVGVLHAVRLALMHEIYRLATHVPPFSSQHNTTHARVIARVLHLDVPGAVDELRSIFPAEGMAAPTDDFGERATYVSEEGQNYRRENEQLFDPMLSLHELVRRTGIALVHHYGFFG
ncbi:phosphoenolpyruvate carboxylase [Arenibaculum pallidiluteum]|uniref:phosphoenolpyruvate carboxylase n=1 Tax=Arenibaculum pallidiluteum TaxID=2812559 RepID=UPI001A9761D8|nr:phosphoenolpyruvate carboxylase [Arenibaculum pallidiluteum]